MRVAVAVLLSLLLFMDALGNPDNGAKSIGVATMAQDGTITLQLRATGVNDHAVGDGMFVYKKDNPHYKEILDHLGGLKPGETKLVSPWPEKEVK